jgi:predicted nucleic-acid-binding protein
VEGGGDERQVSGADEATEDGPTLSALEYTKVMRLLENRELPVDREEIRVVATNAYEIRPAEFDAVVDAAVERGMIVEEDGQFVAID